MNSITQIKDWPTDAIVEAIQGRVEKTYERRTGLGKEGKATVQNAEFVDSGGNKIRLAVWDHPDLKPIEGKEVVLHSAKGGNGKFGGVAVKHGSFVAKKDGKDYKAGDTVPTVELSVSRLGQFQLVEVYKQGNPNSGASASSPSAGTQPASDAVKSKGMGIHGATVGEAINNACYHLTHLGHDLDPKRVYVLASGLVKVALHMEAGHLHTPKEETDNQLVSEKENEPF